ncbi:short chain dehydrogenase reductase [Grosmannia clavigera kw1407]|uniref:Short chain dehydrogenase reductase n=1 Tax=Grosmannia clavigera (strain kw1407 / UAMH 11150) TaxID=655863 RepID=F0XI82_GROCL|nr:short chain dehydrogenase reductase [Grosmannia clavigera kw1407]EFX02592.1 short chain dehydrogenase reductase [Grosmannia clavigera kw1407]
MSARINTILILGAAGGIGEALARRFHALGKKVIVTGREQNKQKLANLAADLPGLDTRVWDLMDLAKIHREIHTILAEYPLLDSVYINAGIQNYYEIFKQPPADADVVQELTTNLTAPILVAQAFASHLLGLAQSGVKTSLFLTSSSLAYFPVPFYPTYSSTKAGISAFTKIMRMQLDATGCTNMNIVEVVPPYVDTPLNAAHRDQTDALQGGKDKAVQPMPLEDYIAKWFAALEETNPDGSLKHEIGIGFGSQGAAVWYEGYQKLLRLSGMV